MKREIFIDCDLEGRDVVTLICETDSVDLFEDIYVEKIQTKFGTVLPE